MNFFDLVKVFCLSVVFCVVNNACAMEPVKKQQELLPVIPMTEFVQKFSLMTFDQACRSWQQSFDEDAKDKIKIAEEKRNKSKSSLIFDIVRFLPPEVCAEIIQRFCDYDEKKIKYFSNLSIENFAKNAAKAWVEEVYHGKRCLNFHKGTKVRFNCYSKYDNAVKGIIKFADEIVYVDEYCNENSLSLETIKLLNNSFSLLNGLELIFNEGRKNNKSYAIFDVKDLIDCLGYSKKQYHYYESYSLANFASAFNERFYDSKGNSTLDMAGIKILSAVIVGSFLARFIEVNCCQRILNVDIVEKNERRKELKEFLKQSGSWERFSSCVKPRRNTMHYSHTSRISMFLPLMLPAGVGFKQFCDFFYSETIWSGLSFFVMGCLGAVCCAEIDSKIDNRTLFIGSVSCASLMAGYVVISTLRQMRKVKSKKIPWNKLDELFKKHADKEVFVE